MAEHVFKKFVINPLTPTTIQLNTVSNQAIAYKGMAIVLVSVGAHKEDCLFHVTDNKESAHDIILGRSWMHKHRCQFDWEERTINIFLDNTKVTLPAAAEATNTIKTTPHANSVAIALPTMKQTNNRAKILVNRWVVPTKASIHKRWLPKKLLQAQRFYEGNGLIWVPKSKSNLVEKRHCKQVSMLPVSGKQQGLQKSATSPLKPKQIWVPKIVHLPPQPRFKAPLSPKSDGLPHRDQLCRHKVTPLLQHAIKGKQTTIVPHSQDELNDICQAIAELPSSSISTWTPKVQVQDFGLNIWQRARLLQCKLFGCSLLPRESQVAVY